MQTSFISYPNFVQQKSVENRKTSLEFANRLGLADSVSPLKAFVAEYKSNHGFSEWLASMAEMELTAGQWRTVIGSYLQSGRKITDVPFIISSIIRTHNIQLPAVYGIATLEYWAEKFPGTSSLTLLIGESSPRLGNLISIASTEYQT